MKSKGVKKQNTEEDMFSRLTDDVLIHILSRMETLDAVRTCVLSSRWKNLWKSIYNLHFFIHYKHDFSAQKKEYDKYVSVIPQIFRHLQSKNIQTFRVCVGAYSSGLDLNRNMNKWATFAAKHNVSQLKFEIHNDYCLDVKAPLKLLTCKSLTKLTLAFVNFVFPASDSFMCFPSLKSLNITICIDERRYVRQLQKLFHSCPVLEELTIKSIDLYDREGITIDINLPALRILHVKEDRSCYIVSTKLEKCRRPNRFLIEANKLECLYVSETDTFSYFVLGDTPYLNKVVLNIRTTYWPKYVSEDEGEQRLELLSGIRNTRSLLLPPDAARVLSFSFDGDMPMFPNLIDLELGFESYFGWKLLPHFLTRSPNLQVLTLKQDRRKLMMVPSNRLYDAESEYLEPVVDDFNWFDLENVPSCLSTHVRRIQIENIDGEYNELEAIRYLVKHSEVLESFCVKICNSKKAKRIRKLVLAFPKCSASCEIHVGY